MASQISHIIYAKKYFDRLDSEGLYDLSDDMALAAQSKKLNRDEFILGCVFPDIRRIEGKIKRKDTHLRFHKINLDFSGLTSFEAGWKFHLYCDMRREDILNKHNFYSFKNDTKFYMQAAKLLEDEIIYCEYNNWEKVKSYFNNPPFIATDVDVDAQTFKLWYAILAKYIEKPLNEKSIRIFTSKVLESFEGREEIMKSINELKKNEKVLEILRKVKNEII